MFDVCSHPPFRKHYSDRRWRLLHKSENSNIIRYGTLGHDGTDKNEPAARFGNLAMGLPVPIKHPGGFKQSSFLIECRSASGFSGSPIFIYRVQTTVAAGLVAIGSDRGGKCALPRLLGLDWGNLDRVGRNDYAIDWADADAAVSFPRRSGMMVAVPAWRLAELLDSEEVQDVKRKAEDESAKASEGVNLDHAGRA